MTTLAAPGAVWEAVSARRHALRGLAVLRMGYGAMVFLVLVVNLGDWERLWGATSPWRPAAARAWLEPSGQWSVFLLSDAPWWSSGLLVCLVVASVLMVVGWRGRVTVPAVTLLFHGLYERNDHIVNGGDNLAVIVLVYLCFADTTAVWSLDAERRRAAPARARRGGRRAQEAPEWWTRSVTVVHNAAVVAVVLQVCVVYVASVVYKLQGATWRDGTAVYYAVRPLSLNPYPWLSRLLWSSGALVAGATYATLAVQLLFPLALLHRWTRRPVLVASTGMHVSIGLLMGLPAFSFIMIVTEAVLVSDEEWLSMSRWVARAAGRWSSQERGARGGVPEATVGPSGPRLVADEVVLFSGENTPPRRDGRGDHGAGPLRLLRRRGDVGAAVVEPDVRAVVERRSRADR